MGYALIRQGYSRSGTSTLLLSEPQHPMLWLLGSFAADSNTPTSNKLHKEGEQRSQ
jgi:hypothetical protein